MTPSQLNHFNNMLPGQTLNVSQVKDPAGLIQSAKEYIDKFGTLELNHDHTQVTKLHPIPTTSDIGFYFE